jgi:5-formyltetrahydrofolate cyclo-ligase
MNSNENVAADKAALRQRLGALRRALTPEDIQASSAAVLARLRELPEWAAAREVLFYWPLAGEVDVRPLLAELTGRGVRALLPRCRPGEPGCMDVARVACEGDLLPLSHGIMEPDPATCPAEDSPCPDLILTPGLAFDRQGRRLGFGGGYYDRFLARPGCAPCLSIGLAHDFQLVDELPAESWDRRMDLVVTGREVLRLK